MRTAPILLALLCVSGFAQDSATIVIKSSAAGQEYYLQNGHSSRIFGYVLRFENAEDGKVSEKVFRMRSFAPTPSAVKDYGVPPGGEHLLREVPAVVQRLGANTRVTLDAVLFTDNHAFGPDEKQSIPFLRGLHAGFRGACSSIRYAARSGSDSQALAFVEQVLAEPSKISHP